MYTRTIALVFMFPSYVSAIKEMAPRFIMEPFLFIYNLFLIG